jgi:hypothetical protein
MKRYAKLVAAGLAASTLAGGNMALADQVIADDLIVQASICAGFDCVNNESFSFDTIRMKENNLQIHFDDTSVGAFPANDWRIIANDSASGGANYLAIQDATANRQIFRATAGAPANSLFIASTGKIGLRTATPALDVHMNTGDTPGIRFEQNGGSGFTPQTWDIGANEANFFVRDVTHGSRLSFRIRPGAPTSSLDVTADGDIGMGTASPEDELHIARASGPVGIRLQSLTQPQAVRLHFNPTANEFRVAYTGSTVAQFRLTSAGNIIIPGTITTAGSCSGGCDRVFDTDYELPSIGDHAKQMFDNRFLPGVGPTKEGQPMNLTNKVEGMLNELEKAHIYIAQLESRLAKLEQRD